MIKESNNPFELYDTNKPLVKKATLEIYKSIRTRSWDNVEDTLHKYKSIGAVFEYLGKTSYIACEGG